MTMGLLLCSDLDRTLLPNGPQPESPQARPLLRALTARPEVVLAYVSGRHLALLHEAIAEYEVPVPDYAIGDVGTTIYKVEHDRWMPWQDWSERIAPDWNGLRHDELAAMFIDIDDLTLQEEEKQNSFKLSYYAPTDTDRSRLMGEIRARIESRGIRASLIWSIDEQLGVGLLDILPASATKVDAVRFLMTRLGVKVPDVVFAGDSGNDLPALTSGLQAILVRNAAADVRREAQAALEAHGCAERLYLARGGFLGMNGYYAAGVLEGISHFFPSVGKWLTEHAAAHGGGRMP